MSEPVLNLYRVRLEWIHTAECLVEAPTESEAESLARASEEDSESDYCPEEEFNVSVMGEMNERQAENAFGGSGMLSTEDGGRIDFVDVMKRRAGSVARLEQLRQTPGTDEYRADVEARGQQRLTP